MEVKMDPKTNSYVKRTQSGVLRGFGRNGMDIRDDNPAPHEFGHMLGLKDKYSKSKEAYGTPINDIWEKNIMANPAGKGMVEKKNLEAVLISFDKFVKHNLDECDLYHGFRSFSEEFIIDG